MNKISKSQVIRALLESFLFIASTVIASLLFYAVVHVVTGCHTANSWDAVSGIFLAGFLTWVSVDSLHEIRRQLELV